jgi:hypothetical protein
MISSLAWLQRKVIDAGDAKPHQAMPVELPVFIALAAELGSAVVVPFIGEAHGVAVVGKDPELLDEAIVDFLRPFASEECLDRGATSKNSTRLRQRLSTV